MSKFRSIKIHVPTSEISEAVQIELAKHGCIRHGYKGTPSNPDFPYIHVSADGVMIYALSENESVFINSVREVPYQSILDPNYDIKIAWANGEAIQRKVETDDGVRWVDWHDSNSLDLECGYDWRIKPKTKTIKQWERKYYDQKSGLVKTYPAKESPVFVGKEWVLIGDAYEAEYEVPNE